MNFLEELYVNPDLVNHGVGQRYLKIDTNGKIISTSDVEETDPTIGQHIKEITMGNINTWNQAYGWGNHAGLYVTVLGSQNINGKKTFTQGFVDNVTNLGKTASLYTTIQSGGWSLPIGSSVFSKSDSVGGPGTPGYWFVGGARDTEGGYSGIYLPYGSNGNIYIGAAQTAAENPNWFKVWTSGNHGHLSGLDADLLDGYHASHYARADHGHTWDAIDGASVNAFGGLRHSTTNGWIEFGPFNSNYAHIYTDRPAFYFNKEVRVLGQVVATEQWANGRFQLAGSYAVLNDTSGNTNSYLYLHRNATNPALYVNQQGTGDIARFLKGGGSATETNVNIGVGISGTGAIYQLTDAYTVYSASGTGHKYIELITSSQNQVGIKMQDADSQFIAGLHGGENKYKISGSDAFGTNDFFAIDTSGVISLPTVPAGGSVQDRYLTLNSADQVVSRTLAQTMADAGAIQTLNFDRGDLSISGGNSVVVGWIKSNRTLDYNRDTAGTVTDLQSTHLAPFRGGDGFTNGNSVGIELLQSQSNDNNNWGFQIYKKGGTANYTGLFYNEKQNGDTTTWSGEKAFAFQDWVSGNYASASHTHNATDILMSGTGWDHVVSGRLNLITNSASGPEGSTHFMGANFANASTGYAWSLAGRGGRYYVRSLDNGTWSSWENLWHSGNFNPSNYQPAGNYVSKWEAWGGDFDLGSVAPTGYITGGRHLMIGGQDHTRIFSYASSNGNRVGFSYGAYQATASDSLLAAGHFKQDGNGNQYSRRGGFAGFSMNGGYFIWTVASTAYADGAGADSDVTMDQTMMLNSSGTLFVNALVRNGGSPSQFLKADGSVDSRDFLPFGINNGSIPQGTGINFNSLPNTMFMESVNTGGTTGAPSGYTGGTLLSGITTTNGAAYGGRMIMGRDTNSWLIQGVNNGTFSGWGTLATQEWVTAQNYQAGGNYIRATGSYGYWGMSHPDGTSAGWIRTTVNGLLPNQSGGASSLGTSSWPFNNIYANNIYLGGNVVATQTWVNSQNYAKLGSTAANGDNYLYLRRSGGGAVFYVNQRGAGQDIARFFNGTSDTESNPTGTTKRFIIRSDAGTFSTGDQEALSFTKTGGLSTQFLKADGSVDSNTYSLGSHTHTNLVAGTGLSGADYNGGVGRTWSFDTTWGDARYQAAGSYIEGVKKSFTSIGDDPGIDAWYTVLTGIADNGSSPVYVNVRSYAHTSLSLVLTNGYGINGSITVLGYNSSSNPSYKYIKGVRLVNEGTNGMGKLQLLLNSGSNFTGGLDIQAHGSSISNLAIPATLSSETGTPNILHQISTLYGNAIESRNARFQDLRVTNLLTEVGDFVTTNGDYLRKLSAAQALSYLGAQPAGDYVNRSGDTMTGWLKAPDFHLNSTSGAGIKFWNGSSGYGIWMSGTSDTTYGGIVSGAPAADFGMYFRMTDNASNVNRSFIFGSSRNDQFFSIAPLGVRSLVPMSIDADISLTGSGAIYLPGGNSAPTKTLSSYTNASRPDITALVNGSGFGTYLKSDNLGHLVMGIDANDTNDSFSVLASTASGGGSDQNMSIAVLRAFADGRVSMPSIGSSSTGGNYLVDLGGTTGVKTRTAAEVLAHIGAQPAGSYASSSHTHTFASLTSKPTTVSGYGITDAFVFRGGSNADVNTFSQPGIWRSTGGANNPGMGHTTILQIAQGSGSMNYGWQMAANTGGTTQQLKFRGYSNDISAASWVEVWHSGNHGSGSGLDADLLDGYQASLNATNNTVAVRNGSGDIYARLFRSTYANQTFIGSGAALAFRNNNSSDNYIRFVSDPTSVRDWLGIGTFSQEEDVFDFAGTNTFTLSKVSATAINVYLNGQRMTKDLDWTIASNVITLNSPMLGGDEIVVTYFYATPDVVPSNLNGTGTSGRLAKWTGSTQLGSSQFQELAGGIGQYLGNFSVQGELDVLTNLIVNGQLYASSYNKGNVSGSITINWDDGNIQRVTLVGNTTLSFSNGKNGASYQLIIKQDGTGGRTVTWPTLHWAGKEEGEVTPDASAKDLLTLTCDEGVFNAVLSLDHGPA